MTQVVSVSLNETVVVENNKPTIVLSGLMGPPGVSTSTSLSYLQDVDLTQNLEADSVLMYDSNTSKWKPSKKIENHLVNAGFF